MQFEFQKSELEYSRNTSSKPIYLDSLLMTFQEKSKTLIRSDMNHDS